MSIPKSISVELNDGAIGEYIRISRRINKKIKKASNRGSEKLANPDCKLQLELDIIKLMIRHKENVMDKISDSMEDGIFKKLDEIAYGE